MIPTIGPAAVKAALRRFDTELRSLPEWQGWEENLAHKYAIEVGGKRYPVKQIVSLASGTPVSKFFGGVGGGGANGVIEKAGYTVVRLRGRNPNWARDELILALDLYFRVSPIHASESHPEIVALSEILNSLPLHSQEIHGQNFRNPAGVYMKLCNFLRLDPAYEGTGLDAGSKLDEIVWNEFSGDRGHLEQVALAIKSNANEVPPPTDDELETTDVEAEEGRILTRVHQSRERNAGIVAEKKKTVFKAAGKLACEVCGFDFHVRYGELGRDFAECHHRFPLCKLVPGQKTRLVDLAIVCANCHRMLHQGHRWVSTEELQHLLQS